MVGVFDGPIVPAQGQPGDAAMVKLHELAVGLGALMGRHHPRRRLAARRLSPAGGAMAQIIEIGDEPMRPQAVGPAHDLELHHAQARCGPARPCARPGADLARQVLAGLRGHTANPGVRHPNPVA